MQHLQKVQSHIKSAEVHKVQNYATCKIVQGTNCIKCKIVQCTKLRKEGQITFCGETDACAVGACMYTKVYC